MRCRQAVLFLVAMLATAASAAAQTVPFGKNKIQFRGFQWRILAGEHIDVYFYPEEEPLARLALAHAEETFRFLVQKFQHHPFERIPLIVYASHQHFEQTNVFPGFIPEGVLGFTEYQKRRIALPFRGDYAQFRHTLRHELVHAFQLSKLAEVAELHPGGNAASPQHVHWWTEGLAEFWSSTQTTEDDMYIRDMVLGGRVPTIPEFSRQRSFAAYPLGADLHRFLARRFGEGYIVELYEQHWKYDAFDEALEAILGVPLEQVSREWRYSLQQRFFPVYGERSPPELAAVPVLFEPGGNFKPALHVGGAADSVPVLFFLSGRSCYVGLYRTTLDEGERAVELVLQGERSAEFESLNAFESRIDVHRSGLVAFVARHLESDALFIWDSGADRVVGRYRWPDLVGLKSPAWDPSGERIVFEGLSTAGLSDLYVLDFRSQQRTRLTADLYRDADPDFSPDGRFIVFSSDRTTFGAEGSMNLFLLDLTDGEIRYLTYGPWKDLSPRWSHDGTRIAFMSDREGIADLYAVDLEGNGRRLTGMTGGTFDPVWLPGDRGLVFTAYSDGAFRIFRYTFGEDTLSFPSVSLADGLTAATASADPIAPTIHESHPLPIGWRWTDLDSPDLASAALREYRTWKQIALDVATGDAVIAPGLGSVQGARFLASDMLGNHVLFGGASAMQAWRLSDFLETLSGNLLYLNLSNRLNFGVGVFRSSGYYRDVTLDLYRESAWGGYFIASYPFSRYRRVEMQLALEHSRRRDLDDEIVGWLLPSGRREDAFDLTRSGWIASNHLALVHDNTLWTTTGPIDGERFNVTLGLSTCFACVLSHGPDGRPRLAAAEHVSLSADYRRYFRTSRESAFALRGFAYWSEGAIPGRSVLGGPHQLRGYPRYSLAGSRVALLNQEWRFPVLRGIGIAFPFGIVRVPGIQGAAFLDLGSSWIGRALPHGGWGSYGIGLRSAIVPSIVLRADAGRRFRFGTTPSVPLGRRERFEDTFIDFSLGYNY